VDLEVLHEVVTPAKVLCTGGDDTFERFFMCVDRPDVSFEVLPPEETFATPEDITSKHPGLRRWPSAELFSFHLGRDPSASTFLDEIGNRDGRLLVLVVVHLGIGRIVRCVTRRGNEGSRKARVCHKA